MSLRLLDGLVVRGQITGYTFEPSSEYLNSEQPVLSYSMYVANLAGRANLARYVGDLRRLGAEVSLQLTVGSVASPGALGGLHIHRSLQVTALARFSASRR